MTVRKQFNEAADAHRAAVGFLEQARQHLDVQDDVPLPDASRKLITQLAEAATVITPGWLGQALSRAATDIPLGTATSDEPLAVRIGDCVAAEDARFPAVVNVLGTGHLAIESDTDDARARSIIQSVPLRLLASRPADSMSVSFIDARHGGETFAGFAPLVDAGMVSATAVDGAGVSQVLAEAESHLDTARRRGSATADLPERLVVIAGLPNLSPTVTERINSLATAGPKARLHFVVAGWRAATLDTATYVAMTDDRVTVAGVPYPVRIDSAPEFSLIHRVCTELAESGQWLIGDIT